MTYTFLAFKSNGEIIRVKDLQVTCLFNEIKYFFIPLILIVTMDNFPKFRARGVQPINKKLYLLDIKFS